MKKVLCALIFCVVSLSTYGQDTIRLALLDSASWQIESEGFRWYTDELQSNIRFTHKQKPRLYQIYFEQFHLAEITYVSPQEYVICIFDYVQRDKIYSIEYYPYFKIYYRGDSLRHTERIQAEKKDVMIRPLSAERGSVEMYHHKTGLVYIKAGRKSDDINLLNED